MNFENLDLNIEKHKHAYQYFALCGHPLIYLNGKAVDSDLEWRDYIVEEFCQDYPIAYCEANGSSHEIINNDLPNFRIKFRFFHDPEEDSDEEPEVAIDISGELKYSPTHNQCVFFPNEDTLTIV